MSSLPLNAKGGYTESILAIVFLLVPPPFECTQFRAFFCSAETSSFSGTFQNEQICSATGMCMPPALNGLCGGSYEPSPEEETVRCPDADIEAAKAIFIAQVAGCSWVPVDLFAIVR